MQITTTVFKNELVKNHNLNEVPFDESQTYNPPKTRKKKPTIKKSPKNEIIIEDDFFTRFIFRLPSNNFREVNYP
ncbi:MAG: hypothetical protein LEGION0398_MBIBDBAK_00871 [Legionellaceae bacterium]